VSRSFVSAEQDRWQQLPESERASAFFRIWTRKEAYLKGTEEGIAGLARVEVDQRCGVRRPWLSYDGVAAVTANWWSAEAEPIPGCLVTVAVDGPESELTWNWLPASPEDWPA